jgi:transposase-like protein
METLTQNVRLLSQAQILKDWNLQVNDNLWDQNMQLTIRSTLKSLIEQTALEDLELFRQSQPHTLYRNGYYPRNLVTTFGSIEQIQVPRLRSGAYESRVFARYQRFQPRVENFLLNAFLAGISTRNVGDVVSSLLNTSVSATKISRIARRLDHHLAAYHARPLLDEYQYLICDGITMKVKYNSRYHKRLVLVVYGITLFGKREIIGFKQAKGESQNAWESLLHNFYNRGLFGNHLKLIAMDGSAGLKAAAELVYPHVPIQRCWAHKLRNVANHCPKKHATACLSDARKIYLAPTLAGARIQFKLWKSAWLSRCPDAVHCLEKDLDDMLPFLSCPKDHQIKVRTTNAIERAFREVRRRTRVITCFSNLASSERIIFAIFCKLNNHWKKKPLPGFTQFI